MGSFLTNVQVRVENAEAVIEAVRSDVLANGLVESATDVAAAESALEPVLPR